MTDVPLDVATGLLFAATTGTAVVAYLGLKRAQKDAADARAEANAERRANEDAARRRFQAQIVLDMANAFELYLADKGNAVPMARLRAGLSALPINYLPTMRMMFGIFPSQEAETQWAQNTEAGHELTVRYEFKERLHDLTGVETLSDFKPARTVPSLDT